MSKKVKTLVAKKSKGNESAKEFTSKSGRKFMVKSSAGVEFWNPEKKGESVEGEFLEMMKFKNTKYNDKNGTENVKAVIKTDDDKQIALPNTAVVNKFFEENEIKAGQFVHIIYGGKIVKKGQEGKKNPESFHSYECAVEL